MSVCRFSLFPLKALTLGDTVGKPTPAALPGGGGGGAGSDDAAEAADDAIMPPRAPNPMGPAIAPNMLVLRAAARGSAPPRAPPKAPEKAPPQGLAWAPIPG